MTGSLTFEPGKDVVYLRCDPLRTPITQAEADWYAAFCWEHRLIEPFNALWDAMRAVGYVPWASARLAA